MNSLLSARDLTISFGPVHALRGVGLDLRAGEIQALCGENGAGKSTLIKVLMGIYQPDRGVVEVDGVAQRINGPQHAQEMGFALVAQELSLAPQLSVLDNIWLGDRSVPIFHRRKALREKARRALETLQVRIDLDAKVNDLTMGQRQLVEIARMIARDARVLILDEPTATLSDVEIEHLFQVLRKLRTQGHAILYVTHRLGEVFEICDTVTVMRNGAHISTGPVSEVSREQLIETMLGRSFSDMYPERLAGQGSTGLSVSGLCIDGSFENVSFDAPRGKILCLAGQIGSGAGHVIRAIGGLAPLTRGHMLLDGQPLTRTSRGSTISFISEDRAKEGLFDRSVLENLVAGQWQDHARLGMISWTSARRRAAELAASVGIDGKRLATNAFNFSGGNQQKILFARAAGGKTPGVILMNEPTRGVDIGARSEIYRLMRDLCTRGYCLVMMSTDLEEVVGIADIVVPMYRGAVVAQYEGEEIDISRILLDITHPRTAGEVTREAVGH
jgi:ribose transport system ATP-binding protein/rhamnose transport system ATP-binding protein